MATLYSELQVAYRDLQAVLGSKPDRNAAVCAMRQFVILLKGFPGGEAELQRRASAVPALTAKGTPYHVARQAFVKKCSEFLWRERPLSGISIALGSIRPPTEPADYPGKSGKKRGQKSRIPDVSRLQLAETMQSALDEQHLALTALLADPGAISELGDDGVHLLEELKNETEKVAAAASVLRCEGSRVLRDVASSELDETAATFDLARWGDWGDLWYDNARDAARILTEYLNPQLNQQSRGKPSGSPVRPKSWLNEKKIGLILEYANDEMSGDERRAVEIVARNGGRMTLNEIGSDEEIGWLQNGVVDTSKWNSLKNRINKKLRPKFKVEFRTKDREARLLAMQENPTKKRPKS